MWELVSFMLGLAVFMFIINYMFEPQKIIEDLKSMKGSNTKIEALEKRVEELESTVQALKQKEL
ncbi:hypothetical protein [Pseudoalteromonas phenolica]|uniref:Uncharacterized protein n=1 Tax=Pseudoalteromonas phenolica TaxID=161398 RepID=A0A0S2K3Y5_9GAMM|nr:hypothetical protein [Pseudoalteromonas phenolica]ALO42674.1 hypothetical protein PP2015_2177 [Pseudoalteromonas phenolica]MBE0356220.1 hypothetical protein [Pseudoalteromonas phenolica O-BC30]